MRQYLKFFAMVLATVLTAVLASLTGDGVISATEWVNVAVVGVGACGVFAAPNVPYANYTKSIIAVLTAVLTVLVSAIVGGISVTEWVQIGLAALGALGVYAAKNDDGVGVGAH